MSKHAPKSKISPSDANERMAKKIKEVVGKMGFKDATFSSYSQSSEGIKSDAFYFSTKLPKMNLGKNKQSIDVEISSAEQDNESLLHFLSCKTQK